MQRNLKLYFEYLFFSIPHLYLEHTFRHKKNIILVLPKNVAYFTTVHIRLSSLFSTTQLVDLFSYELPIGVRVLEESPSSSNSILVYNFHHLNYQERFFLFCIEGSGSEARWSVNSIRELYPNAWWLEREVAELHGYVFNNKRDLRNLMLQYGDTSAPFRKAYPSIGVRELFYDSVSDHLVQRVVTAQM